MASRAARQLHAIGHDPARVGGSASGLLGAAQPVAVQTVPDGVPVNSQLVGDLGKRPRLLGNAGNQVGVQAGEAELGGALGEVLVGGATALVGGAEPAGWWGQAGVVKQAAGNHSGDGKLAGQPCEAGVLLAAGARQDVDGPDAQPMPYDRLSGTHSVSSNAMPTTAVLTRTRVLHKRLRLIVDGHCRY